MGEPTVRTLLDAARRHLWREQGRVAVRRAAWLGAATMLLAGAVHLTARPVPVDAVLWLIGLEWTSLLAWLAWRRPTDGDCALWIDRRLGGASAFTTLLDTSSRSQTPANAQALRWLEQWATAKVPGILRSLAERGPAVQVARALLSLAVSSALALFVLTVPDTAPTSRRQASAAASAASGDLATTSDEAPVAAQLASEIANALRSAEPQGEPERHRAGDAAAAGPTRPDDRSGSSAASSQPGLLPADPSTAGDSAASAALDAGASTGPGRSANAASGHDAGDSPDARADGGVSRAPPGTIPGTRSGSKVRLAAADRRADMEQAAAFDESVSTPAGASFAAAVAAATPPPAVAAVRLSPTETSYVEAWMKATGRSR
jgi:hypothetical protein